MKEKLEIVKYYRELLECDQFLLTGSLALKCYGLAKESKDIDIIIVNPTKDTYLTLDRIGVRQISAIDYPSTLRRYCFIEDKSGIKIDIFIETSKITNCVNIDGVELNTLERIVKAKKEANRMKDWGHLKYISQQFYDVKHIEALLDKYKI